MLYCGPCGPSGSQDIKMILVNNWCDHFISVSTYPMIWLLKLLHIFYPTELIRESMRYFWIFYITSRFISLHPRWMQFLTICVNCEIIRCSLFGLPLDSIRFRKTLIWYPKRLCFWYGSSMLQASWKYVSSLFEVYFNYASMNAVSKYAQSKLCFKKN